MSLKDQLVENPTYTKYEDQLLDMCIRAQMLHRILRKAPELVLGQTPSAGWEKAYREWHEDAEKILEQVNEVDITCALKKK